ncbi:MAG: PQQ-like beta-propeller repeat protein [Planctomycetes bacterium]|nr:PQQ-like beta-propeller repeat protein [Planctomycetota bacterium]
MPRRTLIPLVFAAAALCPSLSAGEEAVPEADRNWPQWRGPRGTGEAPHADPPAEWGEGRNVRWKAEIPGRGHATPVVWGDRVFVQTAVDTRKPAEPGTAPPEDPHGGAGRKGPPSMKAGTVLQFTLLALSRETGKTLWSKVLREAVPHERSHVDGGWASGSPVTDGRHVWAWFGSQGLHCLTVEGEIAWQKDFGRKSMKMQFGEGDSPCLAGDRILVQWDHEGASFLAALDKATGKELWRAPRDEASSWSTPVLIDAGGKPQVVASATKRVRAYDPETGALLWECAGMTQNVIPSPVAGEGLVFLASGFRGSALLAVRLEGAKGDVTGTGAVAWSRAADTPYVPTPLLAGGLLYFLKGNDPVLTCVDARTGKAHVSARRIEGLKGAYASPVSAAGRVYVTGRNGATAVLKAGPECEVLGVSAVDDAVTASLALAGKDLFLRGHRSLYCVAAK